MAAGHIILPCMPARDLNGDTVSGAKLYFYENETTVPKSVYTSSGLSTPLSNPVVADSAGVFPQIFADEDELYTVTCFSPLGTMLPGGAFDNVKATESAAITAAMTAAEQAQASAAEADDDADAAAASAAAAAASAVTSTAQKNLATTAANQAIAASLVNIVSAWFDTLAEAEAAVGDYEEGDVIGVWADEDHDDEAAVYQVESGALDFKWLPGSGGDSEIISTGSGNALNPLDFGALGQDTATAIDADDITAHPEWLGTYEVGDTWDYVGLMECFYAAFAGFASTPGNIVWNTTNAQNHRNYPVMLPRFAYFRVNKPLYVAANGFEVFSENRLGTKIRYMGTDEDADVLTFDSAAYGTIRGLCLEALTTCNALLSLDGTGDVVSSLKTQQVSLYDCTFQGGLVAQYGLQIAKDGATAQGDTINIVNCFFYQCFMAGLCIGSESAGASNALGILVIGGDFQANPTDGVAVYGGQVLVDGPSFQGQVGSINQRHQITRGGADVNVYYNSGINSQTVVRNVRSESDVLTRCNGYALRLENCSIAGVSPLNWFADYPYEEGRMVRPAISGNAIQGRTSMAVGSTAGTDWILPDEGTATGAGTVLAYTDLNPGWTVNQWAGYALFWRFGSNGFTTQHLIASNTANSITLVDGVVGPAFADSWTRIGGRTHASVEPDWSTVPAGEPCIVDVSEGSTAITGDLGTDPQVGDFVVLPRVGQFGEAHISKLTAVADSTHATMQRAAWADASGVAGYIGTPITDNTTKWMDIDFDVAQGWSAKSCSFATGRIQYFQQLDDVTLYRYNAFRTRFINTGGLFAEQPYQFRGVGLGGVAQNPFGLSRGSRTHTYYNNFPNQFFCFDGGHNNSLYLTVGVGRADAAPGAVEGDADDLSYNVLGVEGTLGKFPETGTNSAGENQYIQGGAGTGTARSGKVILRAGAGGSSGSTKNPTRNVFSADDEIIGPVATAFAYAKTSALSSGTVDITALSKTGNVIPFTPSSDSTLNATTTPVAGKELVLVVTTSGTTPYTITFGTNFKSTGTLSTGGTTAKLFTVRFISDGTNYNETGRTTAM